MSTAPCGKGTWTRDACERHKEHGSQDHWIVHYRHLVVLELIIIHFQVEPVPCRVVERFAEFGYLYEWQADPETEIQTRCFSMCQRLDRTGSYDQ